MGLGTAGAHDHADDVAGPEHLVGGQRKATPIGEVGLARGQATAQGRVEGGDRRGGIGACRKADRALVDEDEQERRSGRHRPGKIPPTAPLRNAGRRQATPGCIFGFPYMSTLVATTFLLTIAEPTRLRIINALAGAPLFVSDLQQLLELPQPTVSRHLTVLRHAGVVRDTPIGQYVLYRLRREGQQTRLLSAVLDGLKDEDAMHRERERALEKSRARVRHSA